MRSGSRHACRHMLCACRHAVRMHAVCVHAHALPMDEIWEQATAALEGALKRKGWKYEVDEGGGAFYGPKIDLKIKDAIGR